MKVLVTGFDPFGGESINPAYEAVKMLPDEIAGAQIIKREIPTSFTRGTAEVVRQIELCQPDLVLNVGQAGGAAGLRVERVAINLADARIPDNDGAQPVDEPLVQDGAPAYFAKLPVKAMVRGGTGKGLSLPAVLHGRYLRLQCGHVYRAAYRAKLSPYTGGLCACAVCSQPAGRQSCGYPGHAAGRHYRGPGSCH